MAEKEAFNWSATIDEISAVVRFCGRADAAVKAIDALVEDVVIAAVKVDKPIAAELPKITFTSPALVSNAF